MTQKPSYEELEKKVQKLEKQVQELERDRTTHDPGQKPYREIFNAAKDTFLIFDMNGVIREVNPAASRMYGHSRDEMIGLTGKDIVHEDFRHLFKKFVTKASKGLVFSAESIDIRKDGSTFPVEVRGSGLTYNGEPHLLAVVRDVSDRKKAEEALRESEERWQFALEGSRDGVWDWNAVTNEVFFSKRWKEMLGYNDDEISNHLDEWDKRIHPDDKEQCYADLNKHLSGEVPYYENEYRMLCEDGVYKWILDRGKVISWTETNKPRRVMGTHTDITARKRAEEALRDSEQKYRRLLNLSFDGIVIHGERQIYYINPTGAELFGAASPDEIIGKSILDFIHPADRENILERMQEVKSKGFGAAIDEERFVGLDGRELIVEVAGVQISYKGKPAIQVVFRDITERKRLELEATRFGRILEDSLNEIYVIDAESNYFIFVNKGARENLGYSIEELKGLTLSDLTSEFTTDSLSKLVKPLRTGEKKVVIFETMQKRKNGSLYPVEVHLQLMEIEHFSYFVAIILDVTKRRQAEEKMRESEEKYRLLFENANDAIYVAQDGVIKFPNPRVLELIGYTEAELAEKPFSDLLHPEDKDIIIDRFSKRLKGEEGLPTTYPFRVISKVGDELTVELNAVRIMWEGHPATLNFARDISHQKKMEERLQQAQKMEAIATLAGGIAHQFNNALMGIMGSIELLKMDLAEDEMTAGYFDRMKDSGHRMSRLTSQLLAYARGGKYQPRNIALGDFVMETLSILGHRLSPGVRVETGFPRDLSPIRADLPQMQMVLSAILTNSDEAIENEGLIKISSRNEIIDEASAEKHSGLKPGPCVCLTIEDDGMGMTEEAKEKMFDPFFTTKFQGRGMGMAAVYGIVMNHDGWISVDSALGRGTLVRIYFPAVEVKVQESERPKIEPEKGTGTIILIEDEEVVIEINQAMLERLGYRVLVARTGKEAVQLAETFDRDVDLALLDIKLPDMEGEKLYPLMMKARPNLKVIVCSGYSIDGPAQNILNAGAQDFIQKPFSFAALSEKVRGVLERR